MLCPPPEGTGGNMQMLVLGAGGLAGHGRVSILSVGLTPAHRGSGW
ncbi:hypothetical protein predicted by Glimmer/Critica [Acetobacter ghanensis]|uniref:Uncharacterized protein n=1 Tax=Acetobacter ghanensis TaxID=431306 RepID=A0A0U5BGF0_9PROT|nr:hypothetical protein predicted by Glimmer/Critica [Acetobacter ghanensis]